MIAKGEALQGVAIKEMQAEGVEVRRWSPRILVAMEDAWKALVAEESEKNPNFARVYSSYAQFRENYKVWRYLSYLN
jgi:TRAP-type mannitol/chloroaromatic compound transport system substrate-binding protein